MAWIPRSISKPLMPIRPGFWVSASVTCIPLAGWSLFNLGSTFSFTFSYVVALLAISQILAVRLLRAGVPGSGVVHGGRTFWVLTAAFLAPVTLSGILLFLNPLGSFSHYFMSAIHLGFFFTFLGALLLLMPDKSSIRAFFTSYLVVSVCVSLFALYQVYSLVVLGQPVTVSFNNATGLDQGSGDFLGLVRIASVFVEPGHFAHFNTLALIILFTWALPGGLVLKKGRKWLLWLAAAILSSATIATLSATAFLVILATYLFYRIVEGVRPAKLLIQLGIALVAFLALSQVPLPGSYPNPLGAMVDRYYGLLTGHWVPGESAASRTDEMTIGFKLARDSWFLGAGYGQSATYVTLRSEIGTLGISNFYLVVLGEMGVFGLACILWAFAWLHVHLGRLQRSLRVLKIPARTILTVRCLFFADCIFLNFFGNFANLKYFLTLWLVLVTLVIGNRMITQPQGGAPLAPEFTP